MIDPWIVEAVFLVAGAERAKLAEWMGENVPEDACGESSRARVGAARFV